jgi:hypothetical protein
VADYTAEIPVTFGGGSPPAVVVYYYKRARDSHVSAPDPPDSYVYWVAQDDPEGAYPSSPPYGGPLVDEVVLLVYDD